MSERDQSSGGLLKDQAYAILKQRILSEAIPAGSVLSERQLVGELGGMSKTPIRAALERLQADGLVTVSPQHGILVRELALHEILDVFDIRIALETFVVTRLAGRVTLAQRERIEAHLAQAAACIAAGDEVGYAALDAEFHLLFCEFLGNGEILQALQRYREKLARVILRVLRRNKGRMESAHAEHLQIVAAIFAGDGSRAAAQIEAHLEYAKRALVS